MAHSMAVITALWLAWQAGQPIGPAPAPRRGAQPIENAELASHMQAALRDTRAKGLALAVVRDGQVRQVQAVGLRNAEGAPLTTETVMYGASLTKAAFGHLVMQLVEAGRIDLDAPISKYLARPLPEYPDDEAYGPWSHLAGDDRWRKLTPRILLTHSAGFANYAFMEPDERLRFHFEPGTRYAYSGEGLILLQFVLEKGMGLDVGREMQTRVFDRFGMRRTSMTWRADFAANAADGWDDDGDPVAHDQRESVRAAGSMDTTIADVARLAAGYVRGEGLSARGRAELTRPHLAITTPAQFPTFLNELAPERRHRGLAAGLGVVVFDGPQGPGFFKGGHNDSTGNTWVCLERSRDCVVILSNDVRAERAFPRLVHLVLGDTGVPWGWEYGRMTLLPTAAGARTP
jgi:CubicO group peptidase (beta-lactamase class C family)